MLTYLMNNMKNASLILCLLLYWNTLTGQINTVDHPVQNFDELWSEFDLRYANFDLKGVD